MKLTNRVLCLATVLALWALASARAMVSTKPPTTSSPLATPRQAHRSASITNFCSKARVQTYLWALPALNMCAMKEGSEKVFGKGYNVLPIWKQRLNAKTLITTPNSDVIYAMGYLDLKEDGPTVIEAPPGLQGVLDDFWQRPICSDGKAAFGAVTLVSPGRTTEEAASIWCFRPERGDFRVWHKTNSVTAARDVRLSRQSRSAVDSWSLPFLTLAV